MIQRLIHRLLLRRHFWRYATFSEVAELYASRTMLTFALRIMVTFASVYLYLKGYELSFIALLWTMFYLLKALFAWPAAKIIAYLGPKHSTLISSLVFAVAMVLMSVMNHYGPSALFAWLVFQAFAGSLNNLSYHVDFSKVTNVEHAGKELGYMNILEKLANGLSPLIGGVLAFLISPEFVMLISAALFVLSAVPLFMTGEPTRLKQKLNFEGFPWRTTWPGMRAYLACGFDVFASVTVWSLFMAVIVFAGNGDEMYAKIGALASLTLFVAFVSSYAFGRMIDRQRGRQLLIVSSIANALVYAFRPFVNSIAGVAAVNIANETATTGTTMAFMRGMFDTADSSGKRIAYLFMMEIAVSIGSALAAFVLVCICTAFEDIRSLQIYFFIAAVVVLLIATPKFALYKK